MRRAVVVEHEHVVRADRDGGDAPAAREQRALGARERVDEPALEHARDVADRVDVAARS